MLEIEMNTFQNVIAEEEEKLKILSALNTHFLDLCQQTATQIDTMQDRLTTVEKNTESLLTSTAQFKLEHEHIRDARDMLAKEASLFEIDHSIKIVLEKEPSLKDDLPKFYTAIDQAQQKVSFLKENKIRYGMAAILALKLWEPMISKALDVLEKKYGECIRLFSANTHFTPGVFEYSFTDDPHMKTLREIATYLEKANRHGYKQKFRETRCQHVKKTIQQISVEPVKNFNKEEATTTGFYSQGSHPLLKLTEQILSLLLFEVALINHCFPFDSAVFESIAEPAITLWADLLHYVLIKHKRADDHEFLVLDVVRQILIEREFVVDALRGSPQGFERIGGIICEAASTAMSMLNQYTKSILEDTRPVPSSGTVHPLTNRTLSHIRRVVVFHYTANEVLKYRSSICLSSAASFVSKLNSHQLPSFSDEPSPYRAESERSESEEEKKSGGGPHMRGHTPSARITPAISPAFFGTSSGVSMESSGFPSPAGRSTPSSSSPVPHSPVISRRTPALASDAETASTSSLSISSTSLLPPSSAVPKISLLPQHPTASIPNPSSHSASSSYLSSASASSSSSSSSSSSTRSTPALGRHQTALNVLPTTTAATEGILPIPQEKLTRLSGLTNWIQATLMNLSEKLQQKTKEIKSQTLITIFLTNNIHHIINAYESSPILTVTVQPSVQESMQRLFNQNKCEFQRVLLEKINLAIVPKIDLVRKKGAISSGSNELDNASRERIKDRFASFNSAYTELLSVQQQFVIPDDSLRIMLKHDIGDTVSSLYQHFWNTYANEPFTTNPQKYKKFDPSQVNEQLQHIFILKS
ncbi:Exocyst complex component Exo70 [Monocercomonoides exilis]|uniref:Exocyst complex component Exo70 n=1 Tax=Monocercomonoides exilis TaxID=2049356 RepID=UPI00355A22F0|nr:Exocyst complex component Exo70 [Monocercomonoides exilis]|eukprot:MONOS_9134.1-p1 / transcript=MONOS_9134.1 / gene=MONOS_9134 / organism=Monocercomonoides_exilis_PA203 / gene_product= Exocyst complex component Exo70 / transcript_product= Exocyst complex component Exo70 / location=Mono_scaffold00367:49349-52356(+) / protein_length=815 / sequence_SO=supercontig / SO=protein_coding / is_pseudo=false